MNEDDDEGRTVSLLMIGMLLGTFGVRAREFGFKVGLVEYEDKFRVPDITVEATDGSTALVRVLPFKKARKP